MVWYSPADSAAAESNARSMLERALRARPGSIPVLEAYCRFLNTTNQFVESLVACTRALAFDPWNGIALYHIGLAQVQLTSSASKHPFCKECVQRRSSAEFLSWTEAVSSLYFRNERIASFRTAVILDR
jgi:hypothetical protein